MAIPLKYQTLGQFLVRLRPRYRQAERQDACRIAWRIIEWLNAGDITDAQMRQAWSMTAQEWNNLKTNRLIPQHDLYAAMRVAAGE